LWKHSFYVQIFTRWLSFTPQLVSTVGTALNESTSSPWSPGINV
jgi:hypothetical protein